MITVSPRDHLRRYIERLGDMGGKLRLRKLDKGKADMSVIFESWEHLGSESLRVKKGPPT
jgi:hypothetical protein